MYCCHNSLGIDLKIMIRVDYQFICHCFVFPTFDIFSNRELSTQSIKLSSYCDQLESLIGFERTPCMYQIFMYIEA